jgi:hypothetical protein
LTKALLKETIVLKKKYQNNKKVFNLSIVLKIEIKFDLNQKQ